MKQSFYIFCPKCKNPTLFPNLHCNICNISYKIYEDLSIGSKSDPGNRHTQEEQWALYDKKIDEFIYQILNGLELSFTLKKVLIAEEKKKYQFLDQFNVDIPLDKLKKEHTLLLSKSHFKIIGDVQNLVFKWNELFSVTTSSQYLEIKFKKYPVIHFLPLDYPSVFILKLIEKLIQNLYQTEKIVEYQPRILYESERANKNVFPDLKLSEQGKEQNKSSSLSQKLILVVAKIVMKPLFKYLFRISVFNDAVLPSSKPYLLLVNHQSYIDPFLIYVYLQNFNMPAFLTKSNSFESKINTWILKKFYAIPVRRFETDPAVPLMVSFCRKKGIPVGIFPEGERTWDGTMLPFKFNTIRMISLLKDWPVYLALIKNVYYNWPRWIPFPSRRKKSKLHFYGPIDIKKFETPLELKIYLENLFKQFLQE